MKAAWSGPVGVSSTAGYPFPGTDQSLTDAEEEDSDVS